MAPGCISYLTTGRKRVTLFKNRWKCEEREEEGRRWASESCRQVRGSGKRLLSWPGSSKPKGFGPVGETVRPPLEGLGRCAPLRGPSGQQEWYRGTRFRLLQSHAGGGFFQSVTLPQTKQWEKEQWITTRKKNKTHGMRTNRIARTGGCCKGLW